MGIVIDEKETKMTPCGPATPQMEERLEKFAEQAHRCTEQVHKEFKQGDRLLPFIDCMSQDGEE